MLSCFLFCLLAFNTPQVIKKAPVPSSEEWSTKRPSDDTVSTISSLHSSPTVSPQGSPRKGQFQKQRFPSCVILSQDEQTYFTQGDVLL